MWGEWIPFAGPLFLLLMLWSLLWQGLGLWNSAKRGDWIWFVIFLLVHTLGILEIIYLFAFAKLKFAQVFNWTTKHHHRS